MGLFDSVKRAFNISGANVTVALDDMVYSQNDPVSGRVIISGGEFEQLGRAITLELKEFWTESQYNAATKTSTTVTRFRTHDSLTLAREFVIKPKSEKQFQFETKIPLNGRISTKGTGWSIWLAVDIPGAIDPKGNFTLDVRPGEELQAVVDVCETLLRFTESERHRSWDSKTGATRFRLIPPDVMKKELDYLSLRLLQTDDGGLRGELVFDLQEKSIGDYFRALINLDQTTRPLALSSEQLFLPKGRTNDVAITKAISSELKQVVADRNPGS